MRYKIVPVHDGFRVWDTSRKRWADDGVYPSYGEASHACGALHDLKL